MNDIDEPLLDDTLASVLEERLGSLLVARRKSSLAPQGQAEIGLISRTFANQKTLTNLTSRAPRCVLMCALPGAGKTQLSRSLVERGFVRLCPDEEMWKRYGQYGVDFPRGEFRVRERPVLDDIAADLYRHLSNGHDVVVDHGFWTPEERAEWEEISTSAHSVPILVYLAAPHDERWSRIKKRNALAHSDPNSIFFSEEDLKRFAGRFIPPGPEEPHLLYNGNPLTVIAALDEKANRTEA
jgi:predicted kinase